MDIKYKPKGHIELIQPFLIQRIIDLLRLESEGTCNTKSTQATKPLLYKDFNRKNNWNYRQALGMLTYLQATFGPDLSIAVYIHDLFALKSSHKMDKS